VEDCGGLFSDMLCEGDGVDRKGGNDWICWVEGVLFADDDESLT